MEKKQKTLCALFPKGAIEQALGQTKKKSENYRKDRKFFFQSVVVRSLRSKTPCYYTFQASGITMEPCIGLN